MNTVFLLMAQYNCAIIPVERVATDYFGLTLDKFVRKIQLGEIDLPLVRMEGSQKAARGIHLSDLARYLDARHDRATNENDKLHGRNGHRKAAASA